MLYQNNLFVRAHHLKLSQTPLILQRPTEASGDEQRMGKLAEIIRTLQFRQYAPPGALHISSLLGNKMTSYIVKKQNKAQKSKGIDIQLTVDILVNAYQNNLDTV